MRDENQWPLARTQYTPYYFRSGGSANTLDGDGTLSVDKPGSGATDCFVYNPNDPVPTHGGEWRFYEPCGPLDQREVEKRPDVLVYTSAVLTEPLEVTGPVRIILYAATDARDTDWTAKLVDVHPDGRAFNLCDGIIRAISGIARKSQIAHVGRGLPLRDRSLGDEQCVPSRTSRPRGHLEQQFSALDRNPNTGNTFGVDTELRIAHQTVYHGPQHPSHILLPVIPR